ncbi:MAG TPA: site-2 protease family protein [Candidatus Paceibacterota bacterium]|nr:site-2 protease family protein [Candidatus Paceibacterota bacterium]
MDPNKLIDGLILWLGLVILLTFHEFGHAWMASKCGDDTARSEGRVSLNPLVHIDPIGTVLIPLAAIFLAMKGSIAAGFLIGWARPVPVNPTNLRNPRLDDILVTLAGPWMNVLLGVALLGLARIGQVVHVEGMTEICAQMALISLMLCFFNLLPIPPLDGSQVARSLLNISYETYHQFARYGFLILIVVLQIPFVRWAIATASLKSWLMISGWFGLF